MAKIPKWFCRVLLLISISVGVAPACVPLPYKVAVDIQQAEAPPEPTALLKSDIEIQNFSFLPEMIEDLEEHHPQIKVINADTFFAAVSPTPRTVADLLKRETHESMANQGIDYIVLLSGSVETTDYGGPYVYPLGVISGRVDAWLTATIVRTGDTVLAPGLRAAGGGGGTIASYGWTVIVYPLVEESIAESISDAIAERIVADDAAGEVSVAFLGVELGLHELEKGGNTLRRIPDEELRYKAQQGEKARRGEPEAQLQLYYDLAGKDRASAHRWLCKSADAGHPDARHRLALLYENGVEGFEKDIVRAYLWYTLAGESGFYWGERNALRLRSEHLTTQALVEAEDTVQKWRPGQCEIDLGLHEDE